MKNNTGIDIDSLSNQRRETFIQLREVIGRVLKILNILLGVLADVNPINKKRTEKYEIPPLEESVITPMINSAASTCSTILNLSQEIGLKTKDCYSLARSVVELSINICYIIVNGKKQQREPRSTPTKKLSEILIANQVLAIPQ